MNKPSWLVIPTVLFITSWVSSGLSFKMRFPCDVWSDTRENVDSGPEIVTHSYL